MYIQVTLQVTSNKEWPILAKVHLADKLLASDRVKSCKGAYCLLLDTLEAHEEDIVKALEG